MKFGLTNLQSGSGVHRVLGPRAAPRRFKVRWPIVLSVAFSLACWIVIISVVVALMR